MTKFSKARPASPLQEPDRDPRFKNRVFDGRSVHSYLGDYAKALQSALQSVDKAKLEETVSLLLEVAASKNTIFVAGNGGSAAIADHLCCDWTKCTSVAGLNTLATQSLVSNTPLFTALANDFSYEEVFAKQLEMFAKPGDALVLISSSGNSPNIVKAAEASRRLSVRTVGLTGFSGGKLAEACDINLHVDFANYGVVEDGHQILMHTLAQFVAHVRDEQSKDAKIRVVKP